jgi:hypothetical protein
MKSSTQRSNVQHRVAAAIEVGAPLLLRPALRQLFQCLEVVFKRCTVGRPLTRVFKSVADGMTLCRSRPLDGSLKQ